MEGNDAVTSPSMDGKVLVHDDGRCKNGLYHTPLTPEGLCPACGFYPDMQSTAFVLLDPVCTDCGHPESQHETYEYRQGKSRHCLQKIGHPKCKCGGFTTALPQVSVLVADLEKLMEYVQWHGGVHDCSCPEDDTCDCFGKPINAAVNRLCNAAIEK